MTIKVEAGHNRVWDGVERLITFFFHGHVARFAWRDLTPAFGLQPPIDKDNLSEMLFQRIGQHVFFNLRESNYNFMVYLAL